MGTCLKVAQSFFALSFVVVLLGGCLASPDVEGGDEIGVSTSALTCGAGDIYFATERSCTPSTAAADCGTGPCGTAACEGNRCVYCYRPSTAECRGSAGTCDVAEMCTGSSLACPANTRRPSNFVCRAAVAGGCDVDERCSGSSDTCPSDVVATAGTMCRAAAGACNPADVCDGTSNLCPTDTPATAGTVCRASAGACDVAESCNGSATTCPADTFVAAGTMCRASMGVCDVADTCTGSSAACTDRVQPTTLMCDGSNGPCDLADFCSGVPGQYSCPERRAAAGTVCRAAAAAPTCDAPEVCSGSADTCPADGVRASGTVCRSSVGACDAAETCNGSTSVCPADARQPAGTVCRALNASGCDVAAEVCDGTSTTCPAGAVQPAGTVCRAAAGVCDTAEVCDGASNACPTNRFVSGSVQCRPPGADPICDPPEYCPGNGPNCYPDILATADIVCRPAAGLCDVPETCGGFATCPAANAFLPAGAPCGTLRGPCDRQEVCPGGSAQCPADTVQPAGTVCRAVAGVCDQAETCNGTATSCPANTFLTSVCRAATGPCDAAESCSGSSANCPSDSSRPDGTSCDADMNVCTGTDTCTAGTCRPAVTPLNCNDNNVCTTDSCNPTTGCVRTNLANGTSCDDGRYCFVGDTCQTGVCTSSTPRNCGTPSESCLNVSCDESNDMCVQVPNGTPCNESRNEPHMLVILDNSGTMAATTAASGMPATNSCGQERTRISDAKCVLSTVVSSYGDIEFGLERFRQTCSGTCTAAANMCTGAVPVSCSGCACTSRAQCQSCDPSAAPGASGSPGFGGCAATVGNADQGEILTAIAEDNQAEMLRWTDFSCATCSNTVASDPEIAATLSVFTPIAGSLRTARRYYEGGESPFTSPIDVTNTCRPYYVVLVTDGVETCSSYGDAVAAATELRSTSRGGRTWNIRTYVIGIGIDSTFARDRLTEIAAAGGTTRPYFATDEASISLAFAQILEDTLLVEICNGVDDDCDGLIDEGFTKYCNLPGGVMSQSLCVDPGDPCNGTDDNCARGITDEPRNACGQCGAPPVEVCNGRDDDCDGVTDEAPADCSCSPEPEICDNRDNDCDGLVDETLSRVCGSTVGQCTVGTQMCTNGTWSACTGREEQAETCNGLDDDCDGVVDGIARACGPMRVGQCQPGVEVCTAGTWGMCTGSVEMSAEICDGVDNDCDGTIDEEPVMGAGAGCATVCGAGTVRCVSGALACVSNAMMGTAETCNGFDDNCNGVIDEDIPPRGPCDNGGMLCVPGQEMCRGGRFECIGGSPPEPEVCDCNDNDCDMETDEGVSCGAGARCLGDPYCQCARPCNAGSEFSLCPTGFVCTSAADPANGFCVRDPCYGIVCPALPDGGRQQCVEGRCASVCASVTCASGLTCDPRSGECVADNCASFPGRCTSTQICVDNQCVTNPCAGVTCPAEQFCRDGMCRASCASIECLSGERCVDGQCQASLCTGVTCDGGVCDPATGMCAGMTCNRTCGINTRCNPVTGMCERDACAGVTCPSGQACRAGQCVLPPGLDGGLRDWQGTAGGRLGCAVSWSEKASGMWMLLGLALAFLMGRRKGAR